VPEPIQIRSTIDFARARKKGSGGFFRIRRAGGNSCRGWANSAGPARQFIPPFMKARLKSRENAG
jgi:hypothetical protein